MKTVVLRSVPVPGGDAAVDEYFDEFDTRYADRVIGNLVGGDSFCGSCGPECIHCRRAYAERLRADVAELAGVVDFPAVLPHLLERPSEHVRELPPHDVILAIAIHEQILLETLRRCGEWGTRGVVVPLEAPGWISPAARAEAHAVCEALGVEISFPKPFCGFRPPEGGVLAEFRRRFHVGSPEVELVVSEGRIEEARTAVSAACGATYYVARWLEGRRVDQELRYEVVSKRLHSYPCTASMEWDDELGDTPLHVAGQAHCAILEQIGAAGRGRRMVLSPTGVAVPEPVPVQENRRRIEEAREAVLRALEDAPEADLEEMRRRGRVTPAALNSALLILKREGRIRVEGQTIRRAPQGPAAAREA